MLIKTRDFCWKSFLIQVVVVVAVMMTLVFMDEKVGTFAHNTLLYFLAQDLYFGFILATNQFTTKKFHPETEMSTHLITSLPQTTFK